MEKNYLKLNDVRCYKSAFHLSNYIWNIVLNWDNFAKDTIGKQFVRASDSISANIAEGFGRFSKKDKVKFYIYARASVKEALDWNEKSKIRNLISQEQYIYIFTHLEALPKLINILIKYTLKNLNK